MATEFKLNYSGSEINRKLADVDVIKSDLENSYYTSADIDIKFTENDGKFDEVNENINTKIGEVNTSLASKADLIDGKVPTSQLPDDIGGSGASSWNDLEDKPFGIENVNFTLPEDTSTLTTVSSHPIGALGGLSLTVTKISENYFNSPEETYGIEIGLTVNGADMDFIVADSDILSFDNGFMAQRIDGGWYPLYINITSVGTATIDVMDMFGENLIFDFAEEGLYLINTEGLATTNYFRYENIKKIDKKFLPGGGGLVSWNDLADKPFYKEGFSIEPPSNISEAATISSQPLEALDGMSFSFVKYSEAFATPEETYGALIKFYNSGDTMEFTVDNSCFYASNNGFALIYTNNMFLPFILNANSAGTAILPTADALGEDMVFEVAEPGAYFLYIEGLGNIVSYEQYDIKHIDEKLIPDVFVKSDVIGAANGVASLDDRGRVPVGQLPFSVVDDVHQYSSNPVSSQAVYRALGNRSNITIEDYVMSGSTNPVSSNAVYNAIANKQDKLTIDSNVISGSTNPVSSQAVYHAINSIDISSKLSGKQDKINVSSSDNGKFMRVINGAWAAVAVPNAEEALF